MKKLLSIGLIALSVNVYGQNFANKDYYLVDSLNLSELSKPDLEILDQSLKQFHEAKNDTSRINSLDEICNQMMHDDWKKFQFHQNQLIENALEKELKESTKLVLWKSQGKALSNIGYIYQDEDKFVRALDYFEKALALQDKIKDKQGAAVSLNNIGFVYESLGDIPMALEKYNESLNLKMEIGNELGVSQTLYNLSVIYRDQNDLEFALKNAQESMAIREKWNDSLLMAESYNQLALIHDLKGDSEKFITYMLGALKIFDHFGHKRGSRAVINSLGLHYDEEGDTVKALEYYNQALIIAEENGFKSDISRVLINIAALELKKKNFQKAEETALSGLQIAQEVGIPELIDRQAKLLSLIYEETGRNGNALEMYKLHVKMNDSVVNQENRDMMVRQQTKYEIDKDRIQKENLAKEQARILAKQTERRDNLQYSLIFLAILLLFGTVLLFGLVKASPKIVNGLIFFAFLIFFEFVLVYIDPYLGVYTKGEPMYKLLANGIIALLIFPLHDYFEKLFKRKLVKKEVKRLE